MNQTDHQAFLERAFELAVANAATGGGPFGAVIVKDNLIIAEGVNGVTTHHDPSAHAEIQAIRMAAKKLGSHDLSDCTIYSSCEPCPMCLGAIYWARLNGLYYGATKDDAAAAGFDDAFIYEEIGKAPDQRKLETVRMPMETASLPFKTWEANEDKRPY